MMFNTWTPLNWYGGKTKFIKKILQSFPVNYHYMLYGEIFGGGGSVLTAKHPSRLDVYNDINGELSNFLEVIRTDLQSLIGMIEGTVDSRNTFNKFLNTPLSEIRQMPDLERAYRFFYVNRYSYSGITLSWHGTSGITSSQNIIVPQKFERPHEGDWKPFVYRDMYDTYADLRKFSNRWHNVSIRNHDFRDIIKLLDGPNTFFYLDPPYFEGGEAYSRMYGMDEQEAWTIDTHVELADICSDMEGKFLLSIDDCDLTDDIYLRDFNKRVFGVSYCSGGNKAGNVKKSGREALIYNYDDIMGDRFY